MRQMIAGCRALEGNAKDQSLNSSTLRSLFSQAHTRSVLMLTTLFGGMVLAPVSLA
jgi:hypothetical protein